MTSFQQNGEAEPHAYATSADFGRVFADELQGLYMLSLLMTGDCETAEICFIAGLGDSVQCSHVLGAWARSWAKRAVIQNAIRLLRPRPIHGNLSRPDTDFSSIGGLGVSDFELSRVIALQVFERFVFVMTVLEQYSDHECSLLLNCAVHDIREARIRAFEQIGASCACDLSREVPGWNNGGEALAALDALG